MAKEAGQINYDTWKSQMQAYLIALRAIKNIPNLTTAEADALLPALPPEHAEYQKKFWLDDYDV